MTQKSIKISINRIYSEGPKKNYATNKTDVYHIDDIWSLDNLDLKDYGTDNSRGCRYISVIIDNFSKFCWTIPLKNENAQTIKNRFEKILISSKRKPNSIKTDPGKEIYNKIFQNFSNNINIKHYSTRISLGAVSAERFNLTIRNLLKRPVF